METAPAQPEAARGRSGEDALASDVRLLSDLVREMVHVRGGARALAEVNRLERAAIDLRAGKLAGGRDAIAERVRTLDADTLATVAHAFTQVFHHMNVAEEEERV